jgi:hypothetical protein
LGSSEPKEAEVLEETHDNDQIIQHVAALDVGKAELTCCVRVPGLGKSGKRLQEVRTYQTMTRSLLVLADRLGELGVTRVVMEATSDLLEGGLLPAGSPRVPDVAGQCPGRPSTSRDGPRPTPWMRSGWASSPSGNCCGPASSPHGRSGSCET